MIDNDCDGVVDNGCHAMGACASDADCAAGDLCVSGVCTHSGMTCTAHPEVCGDGIDNDCDGVVDDGCGHMTGACASDADCAAGDVCAMGVCTHGP